MPTARRSSSSGAASLPSRWLPAYVAAIVLGILGMHALAQHCPSPAAELPLVGASVSASGEHAHHAAGTAGSVVQAGTSAMVTVSTDLGRGLDDLLMLCVAMLVGAGAALGLWLRTRGRSVKWFLRRLRGVVRQLTWLPAATGPPHTLAFAVIRC